MTANATVCVHSNNFKPLAVIQDARDIYLKISKYITHKHQVQRDQLMKEVVELDPCRKVLCSAKLRQHTVYTKDLPVPVDVRNVIASLRSEARGR